MDPIAKPPFVLAISSYAVHGTASLKTFIKIFGSHILPVPSLILSGLTNIASIKKFDTPFEELLESTLALVVLRKQQIVFYTGYLGNPNQADTVVRMIDKYRDHILAVITDPVCGDHGRAYVPQEVIARWPEVIKRSDLVFPNTTELKLITDHPADATGTTDFYIDCFKQMYPGVQLLVSSYQPNEDETGIQFHEDGQPGVFAYYLPLLPKNFGGSGDLLLALYIRNHLYHHLSTQDALTAAVDQTHRTIKFSIEKGSDELLLDEQIFNNQPNLSENE